ncbi:alanine racemase-like protein [Motilibacter peucedani]|uniref:Alanine racemase-like protein n=1 Tax=Motilibacter peucedani TaxID=598650 RepID=A0A420XUI4_9ACTN|nr:alanine racemase [Motilibacter peucedani]RKS80391.1 alanine racemase-like protein [Motilibacter peucedani]
MALTLDVDADAWRAHLARVLERNPGLVPVIKGNGYGFGLTRLAAEASRLGVDTIAVGVRREVDVVRPYFSGDIHVLEPWHPRLAGDQVGESDPKIVRTLAHPEAVAIFSGTNYRAVVELRTSMRRHGLLQAPHAGRLRSLGWSLHLPLVGDPVEESREILKAHGITEGTVWLSHVQGDKLKALQKSVRSVKLRPRIGTALWLGDRKTFRARATVLDVHDVSRGDRVGYRQNHMLRNGYLIVVSGGTSHGIGLEAPKSVAGAIPRGKVFAAGALAAGGLSLSPFTIDGKHRWFAEPPHMQVSLVVLHEDETPPAIGDEVPVDVRMTTATFDRVTGF